MKFEPNKLSKVIEQNYSHLMPDFFEMQTEYLASLNIIYHDLDASLVAMVLTSELYKSRIKDDEINDNISLKNFYNKLSKYLITIKYNKFIINKKKSQILIKNIKEYIIWKNEYGYNNSDPYFGINYCIHINQILWFLINCNFLDIIFDNILFPLTNDDNLENDCPICMENLDISNGCKLKCNHIY